MEELETNPGPEQEEDAVEATEQLGETNKGPITRDTQARRATESARIRESPPTDPVSEPSFPSERLKRAAHMLFFKRGRIPGAKAWELKAGLGKSYQKVLDQLDEELKELDLQVKKVEAGGIDEYSPEGDESDKFRFFVRLRGTLTPKEARMSGWRIDNLAALAAALALVVSKQGKVERKEIESLISEKAGRWRTLTLMDTFLRTGYIEEDESGTISLGWRTKAEIDLPSLMMLVAEAKPTSSVEESTAKKAGDDFESTQPDSSPSYSDQDTA